MHPLSSGVSTKDTSPSPDGASPLPSLALPSIKEKARKESERYLVGDPEMHVDFRAFASLHCTTSIKNTDVEGGSPGDAFQFMADLFKVQEFPILHGLKPEQLEALKATNDELMEIHKFISKGTDAVHLKEKILAKCRASKNKRCYVPFSILGVDAGHFDTLKVRLLKDGRLAFSLLNYGFGNKFHMLMEKGPHKQKRDYQSDEFAINPASRMCDDFLTYILLFQKDKRIQEPSYSANVNPYTDVEPYALLEIFGELVTGQRSGEGRAVTGQRTGTCWISNTRAAHRDALVSEENSSAAGLKRYHYAFKLVSLIQAFKAYKIAKVDDERKARNFLFLRDAIQEFNVRSQKLYPEILINEELSLAQEIANLMTAYLDEQEKQDIAKACIPIAPPDMQMQGDPPLPSTMLERDDSIQGAKPLQTKESISSEEVLSVKDFSSKMMKSSLEQVCQYYEKKKELSKTEFMQLRSILVSLPPTSGKPEDDFWDKIPLQEVNSIISYCQRLTRLVCENQHYLSIPDLSEKGNETANTKDRCDQFIKERNQLENDNACRIHSCEMGLIAYDIAAQLAQRLEKECKLNSAFAFALDDVYLDQSLFHDVQSYNIVRRIQENFKSRCKGKKAIFGSILKNNNNDPTRAYVLNTLLTNELKMDWCKKITGLNCPPDYSDKKLFYDLLTQGQPPFIPESVSNLVFLSHFVHSLGTMKAEGGNRHYQMMFKDDIDILVIPEETNITRYFKYCYKREKGTNDQKHVAHYPKPEGTPRKNQGYLENTAFHPHKLLAAARLDGELHGQFAADHIVQPLGSHRVDHYFELLEKNQKATLAEGIDEDLRVIESADHLQVQKTLEWAQYHVDKLSNPTIQNRIFSLIFEFGKIEQAYDEAPEHLLRLIELLQQRVLDFYQQNPEQLETILWFATFTHYLKAHLAEKKADVHSLNRRPLLIELLEKAKSNGERISIAQCLVHSFQSQVEWTQKDYAELVRYNALASMRYRGKGVHVTIEDYTNIKLLVQHQQGITKAFSTLNPLELKAFGNETMKLCLNESVDKRWFLDNANGMLIDESKVYSIDIRTGRVFKGNQAYFDLASVLQNDPLFKRLDCAESLQAVQINGDHVISQDGRWAIKLSFQNDISIREVKQKIQIDQQALTLKLLHNCEYFLDQWIRIKHQEEHYDNVPIREEQFPHYIIWWGESGALFEHTQGGECYYYDIKRKGWHLVQKRGKGSWSSQSTQFLNLVSPRNDWEIQWKQFLRSFAPHETKHLIVRVENGRVSFIDFKRFNLSFEAKSINGEWRFYSREHQGYYWKTQTSIPKLKGLRSLLLLQNEAGHKKLILPAYEIRDKRSCAYNLSPKTSGELLTHDLKTFPEPYFVYQCDSNEELIGLSVEADLYLALMYRGLHNYKRAMEVLARTKHHTINTRLMWYIAMQLVWGQQDLSLPGAIFDCHFASRMEAHQAKWTQPFIDDYQADCFWLHIATQSAFFQANLSDLKEDVYSLPEFLRKQENQIDPNRNSTSIRDIVSKRMRLVYRLPYSNTGSSDCGTISLETVLKKVTWSPHHVRQNQGEQRPHFLRIYNDPNSPNSAPSALDYLKMHFMNLIEDATSSNKEVRARCQADLLFLLHSDKYWNGKEKYGGKLDKNKVWYGEDRILIATILFVLRNYEHHFQDLPRYTNSRDCFETIARRCCELSVASYRGTLEHRVLETQPTISLPNHEVVPTIKPLANDLIKGADNLQFRFNPISADYLRTCPLQHLFKDCFDITRRHAATRPFKLPEEGMRDANKLEKKRLKYYKEGHEANEKKLKEIYALKPGCTRDQIQSKLEEEKGQETRKAEILLQEVLALAQEIPNPSTGQSPQELARVLALITAQKAIHKTPIQLGDLLMSLLRQKPSLLTEKNCFLDQAKIDAIYTKLIEYCLVQSRVSQVSEALELVSEAGKGDLDAYTQQRVGMILNKSRTYAIEEYPEFLVYEYATGRMLQPGQVELLTWIIKRIENPSTDVCHLLTQFEAGGGKTAVLIPLLAHRFASRGLLPMIVNTNELYSIGVQDIPESLKASFKQHMEVLEVELNHNWGQTGFDNLLGDLKQWHKEEKVLLVKAVSWAAIHTAKKKAYADNNKEQGKKAQAVLDYIKKHCVLLNDEGHLLLDPLKQNIRTYGPEVKLTETHISLLMRFYAMLTGKIEGTEQLPEITGINSFSKKEVSENQLKQIQEVIANKIVTDPQFEKIASVDRPKLLTYLLQESRKRPDWLLRLRSTDKDLSNLIVAARSFIKTHLKHILSLQYVKNYGNSIHPGDLTAAPKNNGQGTTAHFSDPQLIAALTIQLVEQQGVPEEEVRKIIESLQSDYHLQIKWQSPTPAERDFAQLLPPHLSHLKLKNLTQKDIETLSSSKEMQMHPWMINKFLRETALMQIKITKKRVVSTAAAAQRGCNKSVSLTATPGMLEVYPVSIKHHNTYFTAPFEAEVVDTLLQAKNQTACLLKDEVESPHGFFAEFSRQFPEEFKRLEVLIDRGAILCDHDPNKVMDAYLNLIKQVKENQSTLHFEGQYLHLKSNDPKITALRLAGSQLVKELKKKGLRYEDLSLFLYYELSKTTGSDVKQNPQARAGLTVGKKQTVTDIIQASMRERLLLWDNAQTIIWIMLEALYFEVNPGSQEFDPKALFYWMLHNEVEELKVKIISRAYQGISDEVENVIWNMIDSNEKLYDQYKEALEETVLTEPWDLYEIESEDIETTKALETYFESQAQRFRMDTSHFPQDCKNKILEIIRQTTDLIDKIPSPRGVELNSLVVQENQHVNEQKEQQQQKQQLQLNNWYHNLEDFKFAQERYGEEEDRLNGDLDLLVQRRNRNYRYYRFNGISASQPKLIVHTRFFSPIERNQTEDLTKPISNIVVQILPDHSYRFMACTTQGAEFYREEFARLNREGNKQELKYALIGFDHHILASTASVTKEDALLLEKSAKANEMTTYAAFLNGEIKDPNVLSKLIKEDLRWDYETYQKVVEQIKSRHVSRHTIQLLTNPIVEILCGWKKPEIVGKPWMKSKWVSAAKADRPISRRTYDLQKPVATVAIPKKEIKVEDKVEPKNQNKSRSSKPLAKQSKSILSFLFRFFAWILSLFKKKS